MYYTGFADEAGKDIETQIRATQELGWSNIEARKINDVNITNISDEAFETICQKLLDAKIRINCFGTDIANWGKDPRNDKDFEESLEMLKRAIPRMQKLGTKLLRGMSFAVVKDDIPDSPEIEKNGVQKSKYTGKTM